MPEFLTVEDLLFLHADQVRRYGGSPGVRDAGLLESAVAQAQASFGGQSLHEDLHAMAAAYLYHLVMNHPFIDGNKRAGLVAALAFLELNGIDLHAPPGSLYELTIGVASGTTTKSQVAEFFRKLAH